MIALRTSCDRKVRMYPSQHNSFGCLPGPPSEGGTCIGCTSGPGGCWETATKNGKVKVCYVDKLRRAYKNVQNQLEYNTKILEDAGMVGKQDLFDEMFDEFEDKCDRYERRTDDAVNIRRFRLFWSGDIVDITTALALRDSIRSHPYISFWTYTRNFEVVSHLERIPNLRLFVSLDAVNWDSGMSKFGNAARDGLVSLCYMGTTCPKGFIPCPVDSGKMNLEGACKACMLCTRPDQHKNIWFNIK